MCSWAVVFSLRITGLYLELRVLIFVATEVQKSALSVLLLCHIGSDEHASVSIISHSMWGQYFPFAKHTKVRLQDVLFGWCDWTVPCRKRPMYYQWNSDFTVWRHSWRKNWVNCAVLTDDSPGHRTVLSSLSHRELRSSPREFHSSLSLPADTTVASPQGTSVSSNSFNRWASRDIILFKYHFLLHILRFLF